MSSEHDVLILGAGPAGSAAALRARAVGLRVALIDRTQFPRRRACNGWIGPAGVALCETLGLEPRAAQAAAFKGLQLHTWDLRKHTQVDDKEIQGWVVDRSDFDAALVQHARQAGADVHLGVTAQQISLGEKQVRIRAGNDDLTGKTLLIADGLNSFGAQVANLMSAGTAPRLPQCLFAEFATPRATPGLEIVVGASRAGMIATITRTTGHTRFSLFTRAPAAEVKTALEALLGAARGNGLLPDGPLPPVQSSPSPAGVALDLDTHVGKRCLLIGDAGGFVAAFSNEGIYPAMKSGVVAVDVVSRALKAPVLQDELATFGAEWRTQLADYLRMPNTDLSLLVPLVFSNPQMCLRVARAFLQGQGF